MYERKYNLLSSKFKEFFLPTLFTSMAGNICMFADSLVVSFLIGAINLSAVQLVTPIITFVNLIYWMIGLGGSVLCSVSKAEFNEDKANSYFSVSIISLVILGLLITVLGLIFRSNVVGFLCTSSQLIPLVTDFYTKLIIGMPFLCYMMSLSYFVRADGNPNLPFRAILLANILNVSMDFIYILVFNMGVGGAGLATTTGYIVGSIYITSYFFKKERTLKLYNISKIKVSNFLKYLKNICISGFPSSSTQLFTTVRLFIYNTVITYVLGKSGLIAMSICYNSLYIVYIFLIGTSQTISPIVSVYNQDKDYSGVSYTVHKGLKTVLIASIIMALVFIICPNILLTMYSVNNPADIPVVTNAIRIFAISYIGTAVTFLFTFYTQALKRNKISFIVSLTEGLIGPILFLLLLVNTIGSNGIWISFILAEILAIILMFIYSRKVTKETKGQYNGLFLDRKQPKEKVLDLSIKADIKEAVGLSEYTHENLKKLEIDNETSRLVSMSLEEMLVNIINRNENVETIDVIVRILDDSILLSIKDDGIEFNPSIEVDDENLSFDNITILNKVADKIEYARVIGLNSTAITIKKTITSP